MVWLLMIYSAATVLLLTEEGGVPSWCSMLYSLLCALALSSHGKTSLTDPGEKKHFKKKKNGN